MEYVTVQEVFAMSLIDLRALRNGLANSIAWHISRGYTVDANTLQKWELVDREYFTRIAPEMQFV